jgi:hypothetical protein
MFIFQERSGPERGKHARSKYQGVSGLAHLRDYIIESLMAWVFPMNRSYRTHPE